jgi:hypothetical protein
MEMDTRLPNGLELSRPDALGSRQSTLQQLQSAFESRFSPAVRVGSSELLGGHPVGSSEDAEAVGRHPEQGLDGPEGNADPGKGREDENA